VSGSGGWVVAVGFGLATLICVAVGPIILWAARRRLPWSISERLEPGKTVRVRTGYALGGVWNPARPLGRQNRTPAVPGSATYRLTPDHLVVLHIVTPDGKHKEFVGPPAQRPAGDRPMTRTTRALALIPAAAAVIGALIGYAAANTSRLEDAAVGALVGVFATAPLITIARVVVDRRRHRPN